MKPTFYRILEDCPVIAAVKDDQALEASLRSPCQVIFVLYGDICNVGQIVSRIKEEGRVAMVHLDLITGLDGRDCSGLYQRENRGGWHYLYENNADPVCKGEGIVCNSSILHWIPGHWRISTSRVWQGGRIVLRFCRD